ncbi:MAG TPA: S8 family serine peptidase [Thermoplasmata archaeon]|nr:S8 family serine peptidase [Thermoplasmata archaeon]
MALLLALALLVQLPSFLPPRSTTVRAPSSTDPVTFRTDASAQEIAAAGAALLEDYGAFSVGRGPASALGILNTSGYYAAALPGAPFLHLVNGDVDVRTLTAAAPSLWPADGSGEAVGLVHFYAPIKEAWTNALEARGIHVLQYMPTDALIVRGPSSALSGLDSLHYVDWTGPYASSWKVPLTLASAGGVRDLRIVVWPGEPVNAVIAWLARQGVPARAADPSAAGIAGAFGQGDFQWVRARVDASLVPAIASLPEVQYIDPVLPVRTLNYATDWVLQTNLTGSYRYWNANLNGSGQVIGIADTGIDYDNSQFRQSPTQIVSGDLYNVTDSTRRKVVRYLDMGVQTGQLTWPGGGGPWDPYSMMDCAYDGAADGHGTAVASTLAGNAYGISSDLNNGNALAAQIYFEDVGGLAPGSTCSNGGETLIYVPQDYADLFGPPGLGYNDPLAPVRIQSSSWGSAGGAYDVGARQVDAFVWDHPDFLMFFAAGNSGPTASSIDTPGIAKNVVTVGGACNPDGAYTQCASLTNAGTQNDLASFGSRGPTQDGRLKPDLVATADGFSATSDGNAFDCPNSATCSMPLDHGWAGTSYATPAAAAAAAILRQYFTQGWYPSRSPVPADAIDPSAALLRAMLLASGQQLTGTGTSAGTWPNNQQGFGRILLSKILPLPGDAFDTEVVDNAAGLVTGQAMTYTFHVLLGASTARFVLAWTDYPGTLGASKALVNGLDLQVTAPNGTVFRGNNFGPSSIGQSLPGGTFDTTNTEEAVLLKSPAAGDWTVTVIGANVPVGPQRFALVATGGLDRNYGRLTLDKATYSEADTMRIRVDDADATAVTAHVTSTLEPAGETVTLTQPASGAPWTGSIPTAFGQPAPDGILEVRDGDTITVTYTDASPAHTAVATATVRATSPAISGVVADSIEATSAEIRWSTDLPGDSTVAYGTTAASLTANVSEPLLRTSHALVLQGLQPDTLYYYEVLSRDDLGHLTRDTNGGRLYTFRTPPWGDLLLVIGDASFPTEREASYAAALDASGWTWSTWHVADSGLPPLSVLQGRKAVIWQVGLEEYPTFNTTAQGLVKAYLDGGGRLLIFSHDTSWSLGSAASPWYSAANAAWLGGVLKASFVCDPTTINQVVGVAGDPVSGPYAAGVPYTPHRTGGADDEIAASGAAGAATIAWRDSGVSGCAGNAAIGLRWVAPANNGTTGIGAWGGMPSRLEYFAFELTSVDTNATDLRPTSPTRAEILDNAVRWLVGVSATSLDRAPPTVSLVAPSGGTHTGATIAINWTASASGPGIGLASFTVAESPDDGQTWTALPAAPGTARSAAWNLSGVQNGDAYLIRILAFDNGTPSLTGESVSNRTFGINRTGGSTLGPVVRAGSVRSRPDPPGAAALAWVNATADDTRSGDGAIAAAELFWSATAPTAPNGTGAPLAATDGGFDEPVENLTFTGGFAVPPGSTCVWVHAQNVAGVWGPFNRTCLTVLNVGPDTLPPASAVLAALATVNAAADLQITWRRAWDDSLYGGTVLYRVWRAANPSGPYTQPAGNVTATGALTYSFVDPGRGASDPADAFYRIETVDAAGNTGLSPAIAAKVWTPVVSGLNILGMPVTLGTTSVAALAGSVGWSEAWTYDACSSGFGWTRATPAGGATLPLAAGRGFWFKATGPGNLLVLGVAQAEVRLHLCAGWNLIALPGFRGNGTVGSLRAATGANLVEGFDPNDAYHLKILGDTTPIVAGVGYWIRLPSAADWAVAGW